MTSRRGFVEPLQIRRRGFHRAAFLAAGLYNVSWGLFSALDPDWLFRYAGLPLQNHPEIFACLAMVVGVYGLCYWEVAPPSTDS